jgi:ribosome-associated protein
MMRKRNLTENAEDILGVVIETMQERKGKNIVSLNMKKIHTAVTDYFVICHGNSRTQVDAIADHIINDVSTKCKVRPFNKEGFENSEWILIDYIDVVVHVFLDSTRDFYQLENLWADAELINYED